MIPKKKTDYQFVEGEGFPFDRPERPALAKNDAERKAPQVIHLTDLNQDGGGPVNFIRKAGRCLSTFSKYWTANEEDDEYDIQ